MDVNTKEVIIVGAGPGGIGLAAELINSGMKSESILVIEKANKESWVMRTLYPEQKLVTANFKGLSPDRKGIMQFYDMSKGEALKFLEEKVEEYNIEVEYDTFVSKIEKDNNGFNVFTNDGVFRSKQCAIAIGIFGKPNKPNYKLPVSLRKKTHFDITSSKIENSDVLVVGGGDSASEYVQFLEKDGNKVTLSSREDDYNYMNDVNREIIYDLSAKERIFGLPGSEVEEITDVDGKFKVSFSNKNLGELTFDRVVYAIGGTTPINFLTITGMEIVENRPIVCENFESSVDGLFLVGDLANDMKGGSIILAFNSAYSVAKIINERIL